MTLIGIQPQFYIYWEPNSGVTKNELLTLQMISRRPFPYFSLTETWHVSGTAFVNQPYA